MAQTTFEVDQKTLEIMTSLKETFGVKTNAQVIRKALALARVAAKNADSDNSLTILGKGDADTRIEQKILLQG